MTLTELTALIGQLVYLQPAGSCRFLCRAIDAKQAYGKGRVLIEPVSGSGQTWVDATRIQVTTEAERRQHNQERTNQTCRCQPQRTQISTR